MPPVLGWAAVTNQVAPDALLLFLIIFVWTPPHFWSLALYRATDYAKAGLPMLPVTHGARYTRLMIVLYTAALFAATLLPYATRMSGGCIWLRGGARRGLPRLRDRAATGATATRWRGALSASRSSISTLLFTALLLDHLWH